MFVLLFEPSIVPPFAIMSDVIDESSFIKLLLYKPLYPSRKPYVSTPAYSAVFTIPLITAFKPGQSPPAVSIPTFLTIVILSFILLFIFFSYIECENFKNFQFSHPTNLIKLSSCICKPIWHTVFV